MTQLSVLQQVFQPILNLLYPPKCASCNAPAGHFCENCRAKLAHIILPVCKKCGYPLEIQSSSCPQCQLHPIPYLDSVRSVGFFKDTPLRPAIHKFKYQNRRILSQDFARLLKDCYQAHRLNTDVIIPVPLHKSRYKKRGYNQSELLAKSLSPLIKQPVDTKTLIRQRATTTQISLKGINRQQNVIDAFRCTSNILGGNSVLLVDDVCTTGATLNACARALRQTNVQSIHGLTLARTR